MNNINVREETDLRKLLQPVEDISRLAGAEIMKHYAGTGIYTKDDGSHVTDADHAAENLILPALRQLMPHIPIVSEERVAAGEIPDVSGKTFWVVDPLDGTKEFIHKTGAFVVAIALVVESRPVLGVIYHPSMNLLYSAAGRGTASKVDAGGIRTLLTPRSPVTSSRRVLVNEPPAEYMKAWVTAQYSGTMHFDGKSGILRPCQVADGLADMTIVCTGKHEGRISWWDAAPGHVIAESSGGCVKTFDGLPVIYDAGDLQVPPHAIISPYLAASDAGAGD